MVFKYFAALFAARCTVWALDTGFCDIVEFFSSILRIFSFFIVTSFLLFSAANRDNFNWLEVLDWKFYAVQIPSKRNFLHDAPFGRYSLFFASRTIFSEKNRL